jgi:hypothetical protein
MQRIAIVAAFFVATCLPTAVAKKKEVQVYFDSPCTRKNNHMEDRKLAKNDLSMLPTQASKFIEVTPSDMYTWPPLPGLNDKSKRKPQEQRWCKVSGQDGDIHFELQDGKNPLRNISNNNKTGILAAWEIHPVSAITADRSVFPHEVLQNHR